jgi:hypothetical protein
MARHNYFNVAIQEDVFKGFPEDEPTATEVRKRINTVLNIRSAFDYKLNLEKYSIDEIYQLISTTTGWLAQNYDK